VRRELPLPAEQREQVTLRDERHRAVTHQGDGVLRIARGDRVLDRVGPLLLFGVPLARTAMQVHHFIAMAGFEPPAQVFAHQMVIAEPVSFDVERFEQQLARRDRLKHPLLRRNAGYRFA
jgi:hypothetical protein